MRGGAGAEPDAASAAAWTYLTDLNLKDRVSPDAAALKHGDLFMAGKLAMTPAGSRQMTTYKQKPKSFKYNIATIPLSPTTHKAGGATNIVGLSLNQGGKQQDAAWGFIGHTVPRTPWTCWRATTCWRRCATTRPSCTTTPSSALPTARRPTTCCRGPRLCQRQSTPLMRRSPSQPTICKTRSSRDVTVQ